MSVANTRRGRPKGSGIDDSERLTEIAARIAAEPELKPTTAIKAMGISDPSSIRRLRDKFKKFVAEQKAADAGAAKKKSSPKKSSANRKRRTKPQSGDMAAAAALAKRVDPKKYKKPKFSPKAANDDQLVCDGKQKSQDAVKSDGSVNNDWVATWCSSNLIAMADAMDAQLAVTRSMLYVPYFAMAVRQQMAFNALAFSTFSKGNKRNTLH